MATALDRYIEKIYEPPVPNPEPGEVMRIAIKAIFVKMINQQMHTMVCFHKNHQKYMFPGGGIEPGDFNSQFIGEETLKRELQEELGLRIGDLYYLYNPLFDYAFKGKAFEIYWGGDDDPHLDIYAVFHLPHDGLLPFNPDRLPEDSEVAHVKWIPIYDTTESLFPNARHALEHLHDFLYRSET